ncbi:FRG domain-containing protein [Pararhodobacter aggregans]|uniref:FRG domain-containing protein n=1 Tax=Pararhodobacter aggregans TaxID=404875 RepID=UPI00192E0AC8|nr:FRG domain-containing protein [Pararhodobacter aggregans]
MTDVPSFLRRIFDLPLTGELRCFRGQASASWGIKPTVMRDLRANAEQNIIADLTQEAPVEFQSDTSMFNKLVRAQHYGLPTRLLDVTINPLIALFYACSSKEHLSENGVVYVLDFRNDRVKRADSDTVSVICNLARLEDKERNRLRAWLQDEKKSTASPAARLATFNKTNEIRRLINFVRSEKPYFSERVNPVDLKKYFFVHPQKSNRRVLAQSGAFVVAGLLEYANPAEAKSFELSRIEIRSDYKEKVIRQLDDIGINPKVLFPEIEYASRYIKEKWEDKGRRGDGEKGDPFADLL